MSKFYIDEYLFDSRQDEVNNYVWLVGYEDSPYTRPRSFEPYEIADEILHDLETGQFDFGGKPLLYCQNCNNMTDGFNWYCSDKCQKEHEATQ